MTQASHLYSTHCYHNAWTRNHASWRLEWRFWWILWSLSVLHAHWLLQLRDSESKLSGRNSTTRSPCHLIFNSTLNHWSSSVRRRRINRSVHWSPQYSDFEFDSVGPSKRRAFRWVMRSRQSKLWFILWRPKKSSCRQLLHSDDTLMKRWSMEVPLGIENGKLGEHISKRETLQKKSFWSFFCYESVSRRIQQVHPSQRS